MPTDVPPNNTPNSEDDPNVAPSLIFLEMMRQAAARHEGDDADIHIAPPPDNHYTAPDMLTFDQNQYAVLPDVPEPNDEPIEVPFEPTLVAEVPIAEPEVPVAEPPTIAQPAVTPEKPASKPTKKRTQRVRRKKRATQTAESENAYRTIPTYPVPEEADTPETQSDESDNLETKRAEALEASRVRRLKRRQERRRQRRASFLGGFVRTFIVTLITAGLAATIFTWFTQPDFLRQDVATSLQVADATSSPLLAVPTAITTPNWLKRIGIVSGHRGPENDPGAVCPDGLTETEINFGVAQLVVRALRERGYSVDLLDEFDPRLNNYQAAALVSIHANSCDEYGGAGTGFHVAKAAARPDGGVDEVLAECVAREYGRASELERRFALTLDMTDYHTFREIHQHTPAAIIELGFMALDRQLLTEEQPLLASGLVEGIICFLEPERTTPIEAITATPIITPLPTTVP